MATSSSSTNNPHLVSVLMVGAGEYNCGFVPTAAGAAPDKKAGVTAIVLLDLKRRGGKIDRLLLCDAMGTRLPLARACMKEKIQDVYKEMDVGCIECFPEDTVEFDATAYLKAMDTMKPGDCVIVFTPDPTHYSITLAAIERKLHVLVAKPLVKQLEQHLQIAEAAQKHQVLVATEYHKRFDPIYNDARERMRLMGDFSYFYSAMTQRKEQLDTFAGWAGKSSDISFYLNSHHIDIHNWSMEGRGRPVRVTAAASQGVATARLARDGIEDTITLLVAWENFAATPNTTSAANNGAGAMTTASTSSSSSSSSLGHAVYMASWIAPKADCHTQQSFHCMTHKGEVRVDQAHRGYSMSADIGAGDGGTNALATLNPLYMRFVPDARGYFASDTGYGYRSIAAFVDAAVRVKAGVATISQIEDEEGMLATCKMTVGVTAILEAGRKSLDLGGIPVKIVYSGPEANAKPTGYEYAKGV